MSLSALVFIVIVLAVAGYALLVRSRAATTKPTPPPESAPEVKPVQAEPIVPNEHVVLKLSIDKGLRWHVELDGVRLDEPARVSTEQRQRLVNAITQIRPWLDGKNLPIETSIPAPQPVPAPIPPAIKTSAPTAGAQPELKIDALRGFRSLLNNEIKTPGEQKGTSIVQMIDEVLQAKLLGTALMERAIRLEENPSGGVIVCVGTQKYPDIDSVPEPEIRNIIKASIAAWEKK